MNLTSDCYREPSGVHLTGPQGAKSSYSGAPAIFAKNVALRSAPSAMLQAASSATPTVLDIIAAGKAEWGTGILIVHTVPSSESTVAVPLTCSTRRRTKPSPCRLLSVWILNPSPSPFWWSPNMGSQPEPLSQIY